MNYCPICGYMFKKICSCGYDKNIYSHIKETDFITILEFVFSQYEDDYSMIDRKKVNKDLREIAKYYVCL